MVLKVYVPLKAQVHSLCGTIVSAFFLCLSNAIRQSYTAQYNKLILWKLMREKNGRPATASKNEVPLLGKKFVCVCVLT